MSRNEQGVYEQAGVAMTCRSFGEYADMFALEEGELGEGPVLDVAAGASSFSAALRAKGIAAVAADPLYSLEPEQIGEDGRKEIGVSLSKLAKLAHLYNWAHYGSLENQRRIREQSLELFLQDYALHRKSGAYVPASLPQLPFADGSFTQVFCSHFLFLYGRQFDVVFHRRALSELLRVCRKGGRVRVYPLLDLHYNVFEGLDELLDDLRSEGYRAELIPTKLNFIPNSTHLLSIGK